MNLQVLLQVFSILYMAASFFVVLGAGYAWSYSEDRRFWNKDLLKAFLTLAFVVVTNIFLFQLAKDNSAKVHSECRHETTFTK